MANGSFNPQGGKRKRTAGSLVAGIVAAVLLVTGIGFVAYYLWATYGRAPVPEMSESVPEQESEPEPEPESESPAIENQYPVGKWIVTQERKQYKDGELTLEIPRLELVSPIINGTDDAALRKGVGLFDYAQLPGPYNSNVSLAGHRDIHGMEFYHIDSITNGDLIYLTYQNKKYTYEYEKTFITHDSDWAPIQVKDYSCVTLQSCDPIGTSLNRIFVVGRLVKIEDLAEKDDQGGTS